MQTRNSKKGRPRKVIDQGKAKIMFTGKAVTAHAGMALISRALAHFSVREDLKQCTADLDVGKHHPMSSLLEQLIGLRLMGGDAISDTALLKDSALTAFFEWDEIAHPSTFGRRLAEMRWSQNFGLERFFSTHPASFEIRPNYNVAPTQEIPDIVQREDARHIKSATVRKDAVTKSSD